MAFTALFDNMGKEGRALTKQPGTARVEHSDAPGWKALTEKQRERRRAWSQAPWLRAHSPAVASQAPADPPKPASPIYAA